MKKSEQAKAPKPKDGVDLISNLPNPVLQLILSRIPSTEEVIRTSILSTRWRYLWTSVSSIDIDDSRGLKPMLFNENRFKEFVYWVLANKSLDLDSFRLSCSDYYSMSTLGRWIHIVVTKNVKLLDLVFCPRKQSENVELPHCLVTCSTLEVLRLCLFGYSLSLPKITGFFALRVLELTDVDLKDGELVEYFLESCPVLEDLSLLGCYFESLVIASPKLKNLIIENREKFSDSETEDIHDYIHVKISCPKLVFLNITGALVYDLLFENLYSLKKAVIHCNEFIEDDEPTCDILDEISHVESLSINLHAVGQCYYEYDPREDDTISLLNLKTLEITIGSVSPLYELIPFLKCIPNLESLHLIFIKSSSPEPSAIFWTKLVCGLDKWNLEEAETIDILTRHLKKVEFFEIDEEKPILVVARDLLEHGNELEEMVFGWGDEAKFHERSMETMNQVSNFHKASSTIKLRFVVNPSQTNS